MRGASGFDSWSLAATGAVVLLGQAFHLLPRAALHAGETAAWLALLVAGGLAAALCGLVAARLPDVPGGDLISLARAALGAPGAMLTAVLVCTMLVYQSAFILRQGSEMAVTAVYPHTPQTFAMAALLAPTLYIAYGGLAALVRLYRLFLPAVVLAILAILAGAFGWGESRYLLPFWGPGSLALLGRSLRLAGWFGPAAVFLMMAAGGLRAGGRPGLAGVTAIGGVTLLLAAVSAVLLMVFPLPFGFNLPFPVREMTRLVLGGRFFERIDALWMFVWFLATACHLAALLHVAAAAWAGAFGMPGHRSALLPLAAMAVTGALFPPDTARGIAWHGAGVPYGLAIGLALPAALALLAGWRRRRVGRGA